MKISQKVKLAAPAAKVWDYVGDFYNAAEWQPHIVSAERGPIEGERKVLMKRGNTVLDRIAKRDANERILSYEMVPNQILPPGVFNLLSGDGPGEKAGRCFTPVIATFWDRSPSDTPLPRLPAPCRSGRPPHTGAGAGARPANPQTPGHTTPDAARFARTPPQRTTESPHPDPLAALRTRRIRLSSRPQPKD